MDIEEQIANLKLSAGEEPIIYQALTKKAPQVPPKPLKKVNQEVNQTPLVSKRQCRSAYVTRQHFLTQKFRPEKCI